MKLTITPDALSDALAVARTAVGRPSGLPALGMVLLEASPDGGLVVTGTNLETRAWKRATCRVDEPGAVCLPPDALVEFVAVCAPGAEISLAVNDKHKAELVSGRAQVKVAGLDPEQFPAGTSFDEPSLDVTLSAPLLADLIGGVAFAAAGDESRPVLAGVHVQIRDGRMTLAAADGYRLAIASADVEGIEDCAFVALASALATAAKALAKSTSARLLVDGRQSALLIDCEAGCWSIRLIEGQYPDLNRIIPREPKATVTVDRASFLAAARLVRHIETRTVENGRTITATISRLTVNGDSLLVRAHDATGDHDAEIELDAEVEGEQMTVSFNGAYLAQAVGALASDRVTLKLVGPSSPALLVPADGAEDRMHVLMPMATPRGAQ